MPFIVLAWRGWGASLIPVVLFLNIAIFEIISGAEEANVNLFSYSNIWTSLSILVSGVIILLIGLFLNRDFKYTDDGERISNYHTFFLLPLQYWGFIIMGLSPIYFTIASIFF